MIANELRIGNKVRGASRGGIETVTGTMIAQIEAGQVNVNPIPLTPEVLEKVGAKKDCRDYILSIGALKMKFRYHTEWYCEIGEIYLAGHLQYLHQLQNFYFAMTHRELKLPINL